MAEQPKKYSMSDYMTAQRAQDAVKLPMMLPDGTRTDDYLLVVGTESSDFRRAKYEQEQRAIQIAAMKTMEERMASVEDARATLLATCIKGWSFDVEFNFDNAKELVLGAPYVADAIDYFISKRANFFGKPSTTSSNSRSRKQR